MKAAVVAQGQRVNVIEKTLRPLKHGEALLKMTVLRRFATLTCTSRTVISVIKPG